MNGITSSKKACGPNIVAAVEVILGTYGARGVLPVTINKYDIVSDSFTDKVVFARGYGLKYDSSLIDKTELEALLKKIEALDKTKYTPESWKVLEEALEQTEEQIKNGFFSVKDQEKVDTSVTLLETALKQLTEKNPQYSFLEILKQIVQKIILLIKVVIHTFC